MAANDIKNKTASIYIDEQPAIDAYNRLIPKAEAYNKKIEEGTKKAQFLQQAIQKSLDAGGKPEALQKKLATVNKELDNSKVALEKVTTQQKAFQQQIDSKTGPSLKQQQSLVSKLVNEYKNLGSNTEAAANKLKEIEGASKTLITLKDRLAAVQNVQKESHGGGIEGVFTKVLEFSGAYALVQKGFSLVSNFMEGTVEEADKAQEAVDGLTVALTNAGRLDLLKPLLDEADKFAAKYKALDNDDVTAVFTKLVDYGKLTQSQMKETTEVIINYARKQNVSLAEATDVVTKGFEGSGRALKIYGIDLTNAKTFTERYNTVVDELGRKVQGAEAAFEETSKGIREKFMQSIRDAQEEVGKFVEALLEGPKSADQLFDEAKVKIDNYNSSLDPLLKRYDDLKAKTTLNKDEQSELRGIIQKIVEIVPQAATEFDKYGTALDINKQKVVDFRKENAKFLQSKESDAIKSLTALAQNELIGIQAYADQLNAKTKTVIQQGEAVNISIANDTEALQRLETLRDRSREKFLGYVDELVQKYQVTLPKALEEAKKQIEGIKFDISKVEVKDPNSVGTKTKETPEEKAAREAREKQEKDEADRKAKELAREREAERKRILEDQKKLNDDLIKLSHEYEGLVESDYMKELQAAFDKFENLKALAHGNKEDLKKIEIGFNEAIADINKKFAQKALDEQKKLDEEQQKLREKQIQEQLKKGFEFVNQVGKGVEKNASDTNALRKAQEDFTIAHEYGKKRLDDQLKQLNEEEEQAKAAAIKRGESVEAIELFFDQKREELTKDRFAREAEMYLGYAKQVLDILSTFTQAQSNKENAELAKIQNRNNQEKTAYQRLLNNKIISKQQYDKKVADLDAATEKKKQEIEKKQFERNKKIQIAQALVNGALGITSVLAARPGATDVISLGAFRAINIALTVAATAASVAAIAKSKYEGDSSGAKFEKGGALTGPRHGEGGMPVINPRTGRKEAEVEGGEVILSRKTVAKNKPVVDALLYNSMYKQGATIDPWFKNRTYKSIDFSGISKSIQNVRHYESGGVFTTSDGKQQPANTTQIIIPPGLEVLPDVLNALITQLQTPQKNYVVWQEIKDKQNTEKALLADATFGKK